MEKDTSTGNTIYLKDIKIKVFNNLTDAKKGDIIAHIEREEDRPQKKVGGWYAKD